jgi:predicted branched-subunit amino acid permease
MSTTQPPPAPRDAWRDGVREALGAPALVLGIGFIGYGSLAQSHGFSIPEAVLSTLSIWALPGQLIMVEMKAGGAPFLAIVLAVMLSASRFLPMTVTVMPQMRNGDRRAWRYYLAGQLLSMTSWAVAMARFPRLPPAARYAHFTGFGVAMCVAAAACTVPGYVLAGALPAPVRLAFIFANPIYFILILTSDLRDRRGVLALACGAIAGPVLHALWPAWSIVGGGLLGGSIAFLAARWLRA